MDTLILTRDQLLETVAQRDREFVVEKCLDIKLTEQDRQRQFILNDQIMTDSEGFKHIAKFIGAPVHFVGSTYFELANTIVERLAEDVQEDSEFLLRNSKLIGTRKRNDPHVRSQQIIDGFLKSAPQVEKTYFTDLGTTFHADLLFSDAVIEPKVGDTIRGGVRLRYSEFMFEQPSLESFNERLICLNGMTNSASGLHFEYSSIPVLVAQMSVAVNTLINTFKEDTLNNLKKALETPVNGAQAVRRAFKKHHIKNKYYEPVLAALGVEDDGTAYGVIQSFTRAASTMEYWDRIYLQDIGGEELEVAAKAHCPTCYGAMD
jgi:hypothetical protein